MKASRLFLTCLALAAAVFSACQSSTPRRSAASTTSGACAGPVPDYRAEIEPLFKRYCLTCHSRSGSAGDEHDFTRFEVLSAQRRRVKGVLGASAMPPRGMPQPNADERTLMIRWACSAG